MQIIIGADELILWLRKNNKATDIENFQLGRKIAEFIKEIGGQFGEENHLSIWGNDMSDVSMANLRIPKTSQQYKIDTTLLPLIYEKLSTW